MKDIKILEIMELFDEDEVTTDRKMFSGGGMLVQPGFGGTRQGYAQPEGKTKKKTLSKEKLNVLNKYSQEIFGQDYEKLTKPDEVSKVYNTAVNRSKGADTLKYVPTSETNRAPLPKNEKNKLIKFAKANNIKLDFKKYPRFGVARSVKGKPGNSPEYQKIFDSYKNYGFEIFKKDTLNLKQRNFVMDNFELPKGVKNWDFDKFKFGINSTKFRPLQKRIQNKLKGPVKYTVAVDRNTPQGWMTAAMERVYKNQTTLLEDGSRVLKKGVARLTYEPVFKEGTNNIIIGFKDNTPSGQGLTYYALKKNTPEGAASWSQHRDYNNVAKFIDITERVKAEPNKILQKILDDKGITELVGDQRVLTLNDILSHQRYFDKISEIKPTKLLERQIVKHHIGGVGAGNVARANATKDIQLLTGAVNKKITSFESKLIKDGFLSKADNDILKNLGAKIRGADGKIYGGGFVNPERQFKLIEKGAIDYAKSDQFNIKTVASYLERLGCGKAAGGRVFYSEGAIGLTKCAEKGRNKLEMIVKSGAKLNSNDAKLATQILRAGRSLGSAFTLSGLFGPAAIAFTAAAEAGIVGYDMLTTGKTFKETIGDSLFNYALGEKTKIDPDKELIKRFGTLPGMTDDKLSGIKNVLKQTNTLNTILKQNLKVEDLADQVKFQNLQPKDQFMSPDDEMLQADTAMRTRQSLEDEQQKLNEILTNYRSKPPVGLSMEDTIIGNMASDQFFKEKQDLAEAVRDAEIQKLESKGPVFMGKVFPKFEAGRQENLLNLRSNINPAAAYAIESYENPDLNRFTPIRPFGLAGGGIAKLAGIDEGPQTVSMNPDSQGLQSLKNRVKNI